ncbi:MAG: hypothetical protein NVSMB51_06910 [Solirubrobacteraceae bacterium]
MDEHSFELADPARRALELLTEQGTVSAETLRAAGIAMPAQALYSLQLAGWPVQRRGASWRLIDSDEPAPVRPDPPPRVRRVDRPPSG